MNWAIVGWLAGVLIAGYAFFYSIAGAFFVRGFTGRWSGLAAVVFLGACALSYWLVITAPFKVTFQ